MNRLLFQIQILPDEYKRKVHNDATVSVHSDVSQNDLKDQWLAEKGQCREYLPFSNCIYFIERVPTFPSVELCHSTS